LGGCRLLSRIGGGGMGVVYRAEQLSLGRAVAVKLVRPASAGDEEFISRLRSEARLIATLNHQHVVQVHDIGHEAGFHYIVMELVDGPSLRGLMQRGLDPEPERSRGWLRECLLGLAHAHGKGIIHRDLKPDNILIGPGDQVKLADFGLAKALDTDQRLTATGLVLGTPLYMSPEAARGEALDARSDLYSLGATFYHLMAGVPPFRAETPVGILYRQIHDPLPPLLRLNPAADPELAGVIERLLAKSREARFASCQEALVAIGGSPALRVASAPAARGLEPAGGSAASSRFKPRDGVRPAASFGSSEDSTRTARKQDKAPQRPAARAVRSGRWWLLLPLLALGLATLSPAGRRAIQNWSGRDRQPAPPPATAQATASPSSSTSAADAAEELTSEAERATPSGTSAPASGAAASSAPQADAATLALRERCDALMRHVLRREFRPALDFFPTRDGLPRGPLGIAAKLRRALRLPPMERIEGYQIRSVGIAPSGKEGWTEVELQMERGFTLQDVVLRLEWRVEQGRWLLAPRKG
jgi:serine/threonine-protein kinase